MRISEYPLPFYSGELTLHLHGQWRVLNVSSDVEDGKLIVMEQMDQPNQEVTFLIVTEGQEIGDDSPGYLGSFYSSRHNLKHVFGPVRAHSAERP